MSSSLLSSCHSSLLVNPVFNRKQSRLSVCSGFVKPQYLLPGFFSCFTLQLAMQEQCPAQGVLMCLVRDLGVWLHLSFFDEKRRDIVILGISVAAVMESTLYCCTPCMRKRELEFGKEN